MLLQLDIQSDTTLYDIILLLIELFYTYSLICINLIKFSEYNSIYKQIK
jgi:hypothetical protein